jgi:hypothetical protein
MDIYARQLRVLNKPVRASLYLDFPCFSNRKIIKVIMNLRKFQIALSEIGGNYHAAQGSDLGTFWW